MKKLFFAAVAAIALLSSCAQPDKCKCTMKANVLGTEITRENIVDRPDDMKCSEVQINSIENGGISIEISKEYVSVECVNYHD